MPPVNYIKLEHPKTETEKGTAMEQKRHLVADFDGPTQFDSQAFKRLTIVRNEFMRKVTPKTAFPQVRKLLSILSAEDRGEESEIDITELNQRLDTFLNCQSVGSLGHLPMMGESELRKRQRSPSPMPGEKKTSNQEFKVTNVA